MSFRICLAIACLTLTACTTVQSPVSPSLVITNVTVIDPIDGVSENQTVVLQGDNIVSINDSRELVAAKTLIDGTGKFLIPGLWDMHVHLTYDDRFTPTMPEAFLRYGITSVRDTGGMLDELVPVVRQMQRPDAIAPRVYFSGPLLDGERVVYDGDSRPLIGIGNATPGIARANVQAVHNAGASFIKIYELVSPTVFSALVNEAEARNLPIASHVPLSMTASTAGPHVDSMEHLRNVELDCAANSDALLAERARRLANPEPASGHTLRSGLHSLQRLDAIAVLDETRCAAVLATLTETIQVPTLRLNAIAWAPPDEQSDWDEALSLMPPEVQDDWGKPSGRFPADRSQRDLRFAEYSFGMVDRMNKAGVPIGAGTDTPIGVAIPGYSLHRELEMLNYAGLTELETLRAATVTPAAFLGLDDTMSRVQVGMKADLVLLRSNPLLNIRNTRDIAVVIAKGQIVYEGGR